jgi:predicted membrane protein
MPENRNQIDKRVIFGSILIFIGGLFLLNSLSIIDFRFSRIIFSWPFFLMIIGAFILANTSKKVLGGILSGVGAFLLLPKIFPDLYFNGSVVFPVILIAFGLYILLNRMKQKNETLRNDGSVKKDMIDDVAVFGGGSKIIYSDNFKGGNITAVFGGSEINLMSCKLAEGENVLDVLMIFGGTTVIVPKEWNVVISVTSILGGFSNKSVRNPNLVVDQSRTLVIKGLAMFGGGEVKTYL